MLSRRERAREWHEHEKKTGGYKYFFFICVWAAVVFMWYQAANS